MAIKTFKESIKAINNTADSGEWLTDYKFHFAPDYMYMIR